MNTLEVEICKGCGTNYINLQDINVQRETVKGVTVEAQDRKPITCNHHVYLNTAQLSFSSSSDHFHDSHLSDCISFHFSNNKAIFLLKFTYYFRYLICRKLYTVSDNTPSIIFKCKSPNSPVTEASHGNSHQARAREFCTRCSLSMLIAINNPVQDRVTIVQTIYLQQYCTRRCYL